LLLDIDRDYSHKNKLYSIQQDSTIGINFKFELWLVAFKQMKSEEDSKRFSEEFLP